MASLRNALLALTIAAEQKAQFKTARRFLLSTAALFRGDAQRARDFTTGVLDLSSWADALADDWTRAEDLDRGGAFDAADLRVWLALAERAGIPFVPARQILELTEDELGVLSGSIPMPSFLTRSLARGITRVFGASHDEVPPAPPRPNLGKLRERLFAAMDDVPSNWMVRSHICGPSTLKALAGTGLIADGDDGVSPSAELEVGPGWVRYGNRRRVDAENSRYVELFPQGHGTRIAYLARPWIPAARRVECEDPHRHGSPFAGKGSWPCEWRAFVENGTVVGVAFYYGWAGAATPENARKALEVADLAQRLVDAGRDLDLTPASMDIEIARRIKSEGRPLPAHHEDSLDRFGTGFSCTLDFLESPDGLVLLEGGPAHMPIGGGHPCAFAGAGRQGPGMACDVRGVALKLMDHVILAAPETWVEDPSGAQRKDRILSWKDARRLAARDG